MTSAFVQSLKYHLKWKRVYKESFAQIPDRKVFHEEILPTFATMPQVASVLDLGCEWYNLHHRRVFRRQRYATIDLDPEKSKFGAARHIVGSALELDQYFEAQEFDLILANGLVGWGVNSAEEMKTFTAQVAHVLRPGGLLLIGWNDQEGIRPALLPAQALVGEHFTPWEFPARSVHSFVGNEESGHTFEFYQRS